MTLHQIEYSLCNARDGLNRVGAADLIGVGFGQPEMLHLAGLDQFLHRPGDVFDRHVRVRAVLVKQIDASPRAGA